jgi:hypothetical protein
VRRSSRAAGQRKARDGRDRRQRFATKAEAAYGFEIVQRGDFRSRVPRERQRQLVASDPGAIVGNAHELDTAAGEIDIDPRRARIDAILDQFLQRGRGPVDDLARGDLVDELLRQRAYDRQVAHRTSPAIQRV